MRRVLAAAAAMALIAAVWAGSALMPAPGPPGSPKPTPTPPPMPASSHTAPELRAAAILAANVMTDITMQDWLVELRMRDGLPDIEVFGDTAVAYSIMANTEPAGPVAWTVCTRVAAQARDRKTGLLLGISHVEVQGGSTGREVLHTCDVLLH